MLTAVNNDEYVFKDHLMMICGDGNVLWVAENGTVLIS
jgi:hypothetical protein